MRRFILVYVVVLLSCHSAPNPAPPEIELDLYQRIAFHIQNGDSQQALLEFERADPAAKERSRLLYAKLLMLAGQSEASRQLLEQLLAEDPHLAEGWFTLALMAGLDGQESLELRMLNRSLAADPQHQAARVARGNLYLKQQAVSEARTDFETVLQQDPLAVEALTGLAAILSMEGAYAQALDLLNRAIEVKATANTLSDRARVRAAVRDFSGAEKDLTRSIDLEPDSSWHYLDRGRNYLRLGSLEKARNDFTRAIALDPDLFTAYVYRAGVNDALDRVGEAIHDYQRVLELRPKYYHAYAPLAVLYYCTENWELAYPLFREAYAFQEYEHAFALLAALCLNRLGKAKRSGEILQAVVNTVPPDSWYYSTARFLADPRREIFAVNRANQEQDPSNRRRMLFYLASEFIISDRIRTAQTYLLEVFQNDQLAFPEARIARYLLQQYGIKEKR